MHALSIALCTYNGARYLDEQLRTLREQEGVAEIVVVDDGSADGTWGAFAKACRAGCPDQALSECSAVGRHG